MFCMGAAIDAHAAQPLITEDTGTQGAQRYQLEILAEQGKERVTRQDREVYTGILSYGIAESADVQVGMPWYRTGPDGVGDASLDLKWRFYERNALSFALKPGITLPTGDERDGRGTGKITWGSLLVVSYAPAALAVQPHAAHRRTQNRVADEARLVRGDRHARRCDDRRAVLALVQVGEGERADAVAGDVRAGEYGEHAGRGLRGRGVEPRDARVRVRRAQKRDVRRAFGAHVVGEAALPGKQARVLEPAHGLADPLAGGQGGFVHGAWRKAGNSILRAPRAWAAPTTR